MTNSVIMEKELIVKFLVKSTIPKVDLNNFNLAENIEAVLSRAHRDVLTGRFYLPVYCSKKKDKSNEVVLYLKALIVDKKTTLSSEVLIEELSKEYPDVEFGAVQKLVNMALKYLILLNVMYPNFIIKIDEKMCDCPLDSIILNKLKERNGKTHTCWTRMNKEEYYQVQKEIREQILDKTIGNITFDFMNW